MRPTIRLRRSFGLAAATLGAGAVLAACVPPTEPPASTTTTTTEATTTTSTTTSTTLPPDPGELRITEWMYQGAEGEFIELTNVGGSPLDLAGWSFDDDSRTPGVQDLSSFGSVAPGESVLLTEGAATAFRSAWSLCDGVKVVDGYTNNLGRADEINIFDGNDELADRLTYGDNAAAGGPRTQNRSAWVSAEGLGANLAPLWTLSSVGDTEASVASSGGDVASPGRSTRATVDHDACGASEQGPTIELAPSVGNGAVLNGAVGDPTNPTAGVVVGHPEGGLDALTVSVTSSNASVLPAANVTVTGTGAQRTLAFAPIGRGVTNLSIIVTDGAGQTASVPAVYAASSAAGDATGRYHGQVSDASAALDVGDDHAILLNDETNTIFLHRMDVSGAPVRTWTFSAAQLGTGDEIDFEGISRSGDTVVITGSHGNNRSGAVRPERRTLVSATITGSGPDTELAFAGRYNDLWNDLRTWDAANGHGLGADALGFVAGTASGIEPNPPAGFNIEGLEHAPDGSTLYLGFRAPTVDVAGVRHAVIVPLTNAGTILDGAPGTGPATFGAPILVDLDGRSIRSIARNAANEYVISAGPSPQNDTWALYTWNGLADSAPVFSRTLPDDDGLTAGAWEAIAQVPSPLVAGAEVRVVTDSGDTNFYGTGATKDLAPGFRKSYSQLFSLGGS